MNTEPKYNFGSDDQLSGVIVQDLIDGSDVGVEFGTQVEWDGERISLQANAYDADGTHYYTLKVSIPNGRIIDGLWTSSGYDDAAELAVHRLLQQLASYAGVTTIKFPSEDWLDQG